MKKIISLICALVAIALIFLFPIQMVCAEAENGITITELPAEPFTWDALSTIAGALVATLMIVQLIKEPLDKLTVGLFHIPTQILSYVIALIIMLLAGHFTGTLTPDSGVLTAVNAVIVSLASNGAFDITKILAALNAKKTE